MNLTEFSKTVHQGNKDKGFYEEHDTIMTAMMEQNWPQELVDSYKKAFIDQRLALIMSEASEAVEANRKGNVANISEFQQDKQGSPFHAESIFKRAFEENIKDSTEDELSDVLIRVLDLAGYLGMDLQYHVENKLIYNSLRAHKHGKKY